MRMTAMLFATLLVLGGNAAGAHTSSTTTATTKPVVKHSGGTDKYGCHRDRKRGGYHCH